MPKQLGGKGAERRRIRSDALTLAPSSSPGAGRLPAQRLGGAAVSFSEERAELIAARHDTVAMIEGFRGNRVAKSFDHFAFDNVKLKASESEIETIHCMRKDRQSASSARTRSTTSTTRTVKLLAPFVRIQLEDPTTPECHRGTTGEGAATKRE
jgi:hypothetical protein